MTYFRQALALLVAQLISVPVVIGLFRYMPSREWASWTASGLFMALGVAAIVVSFSWPRFWQRGTFWMGQVHLFMFSIPLAVSRWAQQGVPFEEVLVYGQPGPVVHRWASYMFLVWVAATGVDSLLLRRPISRPIKNAPQE